jgi:hypothetical protein
MKKIVLLAASFFAFTPMTHAVIGQWCGNDAMCSAGERCNLEDSRRDLRYNVLNCIPAGAIGPVSPVPAQPSPVAGPNSAPAAGPANTGGSSAGAGPTNPSTTLINPLGSGITDLPSLINAIMDFVVKIGAIVVIFMLVYVGFLFVMAQGNEQKIKDARRALLYTVIGALILLGAKVIAEGIRATVQALGT